MPTFPHANAPVPRAAADPAPDFAALRAATPGCERHAFFNHSGASLASAATLATIKQHLDREARDGAMEAGAAAEPLIDATRRDAEALLNAGADDVAFTSSATAAIGLAFAALPPLRADDRILVGRHEWGGNVSTYTAAAERAGARVEVIPCRDDGSVDPEALARMLDERVRLVSLTWLPANGGLVNDAAAIGRVTRAAGVPYFVDAGQALGQLPVDVQAIGCDVLKGTARKFLRGPRGTALLYVRRGFVPQLRPAFLDVQSAPWVYGRVTPREDARVFETVEIAVALLAGLGVALREARAIGIPAIQQRIAGLSSRLRAQLGDTPGVTLRDLGTRRSGLVSFTVDGMAPQDVRQRLARQHIVVGANGVSYTPFDMSARGLTGIVRASISHLNTEDEIDRLVAAVAALGR
jgi:cysteine desulfurase/selenocysteine lyase